MQGSTRAKSTVKHAKEKVPVVSVKRGLKDYLAECLLIVFSVILALVLTEFINNLNDRKNTSEILHELKDELIENKKNEEAQYAYHVQALKKIDSALKDPLFAKQFIVNGEINLNIIAPHGVIFQDLNDVAWQIAKQNNIVSKIDISTYGLLNTIYNNQARITNSEDKIGQILLSYESRKPENLRTTLILFSDSYRAWDVDRAPRLIENYQKAIEILNKY
jgi:hypothetical protein